MLSEAARRTTWVGGGEALMQMLPAAAAHFHCRRRRYTGYIVISHGNQAANKALLK